MNVVTHNLAAMNATRQYNIAVKAGRKSAEKLSSGYRINRAADDAAGLTISEKMRAQIRGLNQGAENIETGISYVQVADGALEEVHSMLQRINELAVQSANGTNSESDRKALDDEMQQLKTEMQRVFESTTFNEKQIWPEGSIEKTSVWVGTKQVQGVSVATPAAQRMDINNQNYDKVAYSSYQLLADDTGIRVSWTDFDGDEHTTLAADWDTLEANNYSFQIADYFDTADTALFDNGTPLFDFQIAFKVEPEAEVADIIAAVNNTAMSTNTAAYISANFEDASGNSITQTGVSVASASINYSAAYASRENANISNGETGYDFENATDSFLEATTSSVTDGNLDEIPENNTSDVSVAQTSTEGWSFTFEMEGIGEVKATSDYIYYYSNDGDSDDEGLWWQWNKRTDGTRYKSTIYRYPTEYGDASLGTLMSTLTGSSGTGTPGLLTEANGGVADSGGYVLARFALNSTNSYTYGSGQTSDSVGYFTLRVAVNNTDTEESVLQKINDALNTTTIVDLYTSDSNVKSASHTVYRSYINTSMVERDVYQMLLDYGNVNLNIHSGPTATDKIALNYKCLRVAALGLEDTNVLTEDSATNAIDEVALAIRLVSEQRSKFGAYQNRMEHANAINLNTSENTTAAESRIRDTDMAEESVKHTKESILQQAGQAVMARANQNTQGVLNLLNK